jgi:hypothetical protein
MAAARRYETGVYADDVLEHYFPPAMAIVSNSAAGRAFSTIIKKPKSLSSGRRGAPRPGDPLAPRRNRIVRPKETRCKDRSE